MERDLSAWLSNPLQQEAMKRIYSLEEKVKTINDQDLIEVWEKLQTSDHFYYMCTKFWSDGDVHKYFSPYDSPYDAYIYYMNVFSDLENIVNAAYAERKQKAVPVVKIKTTKTKKSTGKSKAKSKELETVLQLAG